MSSTESSADSEREPLRVPGYQAQLEHAIVDVIRKAFPGHEMLGEESHAGDATAAVEVNGASRMTRATGFCAATATATPEPSD